MKFLDPKRLSRNLFLLGLSIIFISLSSDLIGLGDKEIHIGWVQWCGIALGFVFTFLGILNWRYKIHAIQSANEYFCSLRQSWSVPSLQRPAPIVLTIMCIMTILWQGTFSLAADKLDRTYVNRAASGMSYQYSFIYFYYYKNLYPVFSTINDVFYHDWQKTLGQPTISGFVKPQYSEQAADNLMKKYPGNLLMELGWVIRPGDDGKTLLYFPEVILRGTPEGAGVTWLLSWVFTLSLVALLIASYYTNAFPLGIFLVLFLGSHPFQLAEIYNKGYSSEMGGLTWFTGQVFSFPISITVFLLALHFPLIFDKRVSKYYLWLLPVLSGVVIASARQVRGENIVAIVSVMICYALVNYLDWFKKFLLFVLVVFSFLITSQGWIAYFDYKFSQAYEVVKNVGGHPLSIDEKLNYHLFWAQLWVGLGDFGASKGYVWSDYVEDTYVCPILINQGKWEGACRDMSGIYPRLAWTIPEYEAISRDLIIKDITSDPVWYLIILLKRVQRILVEVAPLRLGIGALYFDIPVSGGILIPFLVLLVFIRSWPYLKLILFTLPLAFSALIIYSAGGMTYYSIFLQVGAAICCGAFLSSIICGYRIVYDKWRRPTAS